MVDVIHFGSLITDTVAGKVFKVASITINGAQNTGYPFLCGAGNYQVTAGKTFYITGLHYSDVNTTYTGYVCYADDAAQTTNRVGLGIQLIYNTYYTGWNADFAAGVIPFYATVPASKYLGVYTTLNNTPVNMSIIGYEA